MTTDAQTAALHTADPPDSGALKPTVLRHPQGCCTYVLIDPASREALALDVHLDFVQDVAEHVRAEGGKLRYVVDSHTHADHPSGSAALAELTDATRVAHAEGQHTGVTLHPADDDLLHLGDHRVAVRHAPGHTPDHLVLISDNALYSGDSLFIGGVARTDFLGGDAGTLYDSLQRILEPLGDGVLVYPGHDYEGRGHSTVGAERAHNPWLQMSREDFVKHLVANPPPRPANMDDLLRLNRSGVEIPATISAGETVRHVESGGATTVIDVRTGAEYDAEHVPGSRLIPLDRLVDRIDEVRATPAPRLLLCRSGARAEMARKSLAQHHVAGLTVIEGGFEAYARAGGEVERGKAVMSLERQVRIAAGSLVVLGLALAWLVHPGFATLSAFVGAGLVFAGLTNTCAMGMLLAKAPWNRSAAESPAEGVSACAASAPGACAASAPTACAASPPPKTD